MSFFVFALVCYICFGFWLILWWIWKNTDEICCKIALGTLFVICGSAGILTGFVTGLAQLAVLVEIPCFSILAVVFHRYCTKRWDHFNRWDHISNARISDILKMILNFIGDASNRNNDRIIRILAVNYAHSSSNSLGTFIVERKREEALHQVTYAEIREHSEDPEKAKFVSSLISDYFEIWTEYFGEEVEFAWDPDKLLGSLEILMLFALLYVFLPIYLLSRIVTVFYPYFIVGYLSYHGLWTEVGLFELVMLGSYIGLQALMLVLGVSVFRIHLWLWHIVPGEYNQSESWTSGQMSFLKRMCSFYDSALWFPLTRQILVDDFGTDIGHIIMDYMKEMDDVDADSH